MQDTSVGRRSLMRGAAWAAPVAVVAVAAPAYATSSTPPNSIWTVCKVPHTKNGKTTYELVFTLIFDKDVTFVTVPSNRITFNGVSTTHWTMNKVNARTWQFKMTDYVDVDDLDGSWSLTYKADAFPSKTIGGSYNAYGHYCP